MIHRLSRAPSLLALASFLAGCSSAVGTVTPAYGTSPVPVAPTASVTFTVTLGTSGAAANRRKPAYLSAQTRSVSILPVVVGNPNQQATIVNIGSGVMGCTGSGSGLACTGTVVAPVGQTSFTVTTYAEQNAGGAVLSVGTITLDVLASGAATNISNASSLTLSGVPASFTLSVSPKSITIGTASKLVADVTAYDASGAAIIGPSDYTTGVDIETITPFSANGSVLTATAPAPFVPGCTYPVVAGVTSCHPVSIAVAPSQSIELAYSGEYVAAKSIELVGESPGLATHALAIPVATQPSKGGCTGSPIVVCPGQVTFKSPSSPSVPLTVTETGVTTFAESDYGCVGDDIASINFQKMTSGDSFTVYPGNQAGTCVALFTDAAGNSTSLNIGLLSSSASPSPSPTNTPTPVVTPTPVPGPIKITPSGTIEFTSSTASPQQIMASETGVSSFTVDATMCAGIVTVTPASGTSFTIAPVASLVKGGACSLLVDNPSGQSASVPILVDGLSIIINSKR